MRWGNVFWRWGNKEGNLSDLRYGRYGDCREKNEEFSSEGEGSNNGEDVLS